MQPTHKIAATVQRLRSPRHRRLPAVRHWLPASQRPPSSVGCHWLLASQCLPSSAGHHRLLASQCLQVDNRPLPGHARRSRTAFTLVELMVVITIIAILASMMLFAMQGAQESGRAAKTRSLIAKIDAVITPLYEDYRSRSIPVAVPMGVTGNGVAKVRLDALRELQRLEMPDRWTDVGVYHATTPTMSAIVTSIPRPAIAQAYFRKYRDAVLAGHSEEDLHKNEQAETLFLIVSMLGEDGLENFSESDIGDTDGDGLKEFIDGWGNPIRWLRWPAGFDSPMNRRIGSGTRSGSTATSLIGDVNLSDVDNAYTGMAVRFTTGSLKREIVRVTNYVGATRTFTLATGLSGAPAQGDRFNVLGPDKFDGYRIYPRPGQLQLTFEIHPMIFSSGADGEHSLVLDSVPLLTYGTSTVNNNPYVETGGPGSMEYMGTIDHSTGYAMDNITNHDLGRR